MFHLLNFQKYINDSTKKKKKMLGVAVPYPQFFGHTGTCTGTETLTKVLESTQSVRQTDKSYGSI